MARTFGVEVEFGYGTGCNATRVLEELRNRGLTQHTGLAGYIGHSDTQWVLKNDASVSRGAELVSPPLDFDNPEHREQVNSAMAALRAAGAITDRQAGIHVHVGASDLDAEQVACVARCFMKFEDVIYRLASSGWQSMRPGSQQYCPTFREQQRQDMTKVKDLRGLSKAYFGDADSHVYAGGSHGHQARYCGLNIHSWFYRKTIEFRVFNSSLNHERVQAYIAMCVALVEDGRRRNKRSINKAYRVGQMASGAVKSENAYHRFQQVLRYEAGLDLADMKLLNRCWKDSVAQPASSVSRSY